MTESDDDSAAAYDPEKICVALALRVACWSYYDIADKLGVDQHTAFMMVRDGLRNKPADFDARFHEISRGEPVAEAEGDQEEALKADLAKAGVEAPGQRRLETRKMRKHSVRYLSEG
jgi:hypothetical protein